MQSANNFVSLFVVLVLSAHSTAAYAGGPNDGHGLRGTPTGDINSQRIPAITRFNANPFLPADRAIGGDRVCCMAMTPACLACAAGVTVDAYCAWHPQVPGCVPAATSLSSAATTAEDAGDTGDRRLSSESLECTVEARRCGIVGGCLLSVLGSAVRHAACHGGHQQYPACKRYATEGTAGAWVACAWELAGVVPFGSAIPRVGVCLVKEGLACAKMINDANSR